jgi:hypothetical protein
MATQKTNLSCEMFVLFQVEAKEQLDTFQKQGKKSFKILSAKERMKKNISNLRLFMNIGESLLATND